MTVYIYLRQSAPSDRENSVSFEVQQAKCVEALRAQGVKGRVEVVRETGTAYRKNVKNKQPQLRGVISRLRHGDTVMVYRVDRFSRDILLGTELLRRIIDAGATLKVATAGYTSSDIHGVKEIRKMILDAESEGDTQSVRAKHSLDLIREKGGHIGTVPFGYERYRGADGISRLRENHREQQIIQFATLLHKAGLTIDEANQALRALIPRATPIVFTHTDDPDIVLTVVKQLPFTDVASLLNEYDLYRKRPWTGPSISKVIKNFQSKGTLDEAISLFARSSLNRGAASSSSFNFEDRSHRKPVRRDNLKK